MPKRGAAPGGRARALASPGIVCVARRLPVGAGLGLPALGSTPSAACWRRLWAPCSDGPLESFSCIFSSKAVQSPNFPHARVARAVWTWTLGAGAGRVNASLFQQRRVPLLPHRGCGRFEPPRGWLRFPSVWGLVSNAQPPTLRDRDRLRPGCLLFSGLILFHHGVERAARNHGRRFKTRCLFLPFGSVVSLSYRLSSNFQGGPSE